MREYTEVAPARAPTTDDRARYEAKPSVASVTTQLPAPRAWVSARPSLGGYAKRLLDFVLATVGLLLSAPLWPVIAAAIKLEDGGAVFYTQKRWGYGGERLTVRKFRTMVPNSDEMYGIRQAAENDGRVTRLGAVLRAMGLDELPQLLLILRGKMSFVGPRPLAVGEIVEDEQGSLVHYERLPDFRKRQSVRPGLTSLATLHLPKDTCPVRKFRYDIRYVDRRSLLLDIKLILLSVWISVRGKWESRNRKL